jgi:hypothetical protein
MRIIEMRRQQRESGLARQRRKLQCRQQITPLLLNPARCTAVDLNGVSCHAS